MAVSKAQQAATNKWIAKAYDRINLTVEKGKRDVIKAHAGLKDGGSVNAFINRAIDEAMENDSTEGSQEATRAGEVSLPSETVKTAQEAAQAAGEDTAQFISRAVAAQAQGDIRARLNEERQEHTTDALVREIEDTARLVTSTLWGNIFYNDKLYKKPKDAQEVRTALVECKQGIVAMLDNLIKNIEPDAHSR